MLKPWTWKGKPYLIPVTHEPGVQRGEGMGAKGVKKAGSSSPGGRGNAKRSSFWPVGRWAGGAVK